MRIYETHRIRLNSDDLALRVKFLNKIESCKSKAQMEYEKKMYYDFMRSKFGINQLMIHHPDKAENFLIVFPISSSENNIYEMYFDNINQLYYIEITECN